MKEKLWRNRAPVRYGDFGDRKDRNFLNYYWKENARPIRIEPRPGIDLSFANKRTNA